MFGVYGICVLGVSNPDVHKVTVALKQAAQHSPAPACARTRAVSPTPASHSHHLAVSKTFKTLSLVGGTLLTSRLVSVVVLGGGGGSSLYQNTSILFSSAHPSKASDGYSLLATNFFNIAVLVVLVFCGALSPSRRCF